MKKLTILFLLISLFVFIGCKNPVDNERITAIAKCLGEKGFKMYGAVWCGHCKDQKESFGEAFKYIEYIECDAQTNLEQAKICVEKEISGVPAWEFPDGTMEAGFIEPEKLAELADC